MIKNLNASWKKHRPRASPEAKLNKIESAARRKPRVETGPDEKGSKIQAKPHKSSLSNRPIPKTTPFKPHVHRHFATIPLP